MSAVCLDWSFRSFHSLNPSCFVYRHPEWKSVILIARYSICYHKLVDYLHGPCLTPNFLRYMRSAFLEVCFFSPRSEQWDTLPILPYLCYGDTVSGVFSIILFIFMRSANSQSFSIIKSVFCLLQALRLFVRVLKLSWELGLIGCSWCISYQWLAFVIVRAFLEFLIIIPVLCF